MSRRLHPPQLSACAQPINMPEFYLEGSTTGVDDDDQDVTLQVRCHGAVFHIWFEAETIKAPALLQQHLDFLHALDIGDSDKVASQIKPFESLMATLAPETETAGYLLSDFLYPRHFILRATADMTPLSAEAITEEDLELPGDYMRRNPQFSNLELDKWVPKTYSSREIRLVSAPGQRDARLSGPKKVIAGGNAYFFKQWRGIGNPPGASFRELDTYKRIHNALALGQIRPDLRICRLHGIVVDRDDDETPHSANNNSRLVGILLTFIETNKPTWQGTLSSRVRGGGLSSETLSRWAQELDTWVTALHEAHIVWGDVKPENILVDKDDNIWAIDFGGSYTVGWVDEKRCETMEGDLQGVEKIKSFLARNEKGPTHAPSI